MLFSIFATPEPTPVPIDPDAARLDRVADYMLHLGYGKQAERLSRAAAEMREAGR